MLFEKEYIKNKLKGSLAETIFELLHLELGCQVYRTGHEFLYPHLFLIANTKKKITHRFFKEGDYYDMFESDIDEDRKKMLDEEFVKRYGEEEAEKEVKEFLKRIIGKWRFEKSTTGSVLASSPDFTIITPSGCIEEFEVKFRSNGELTNEEKKRYLKRDAMPSLFIVMVKEPYIKILKPWVDELHDNYDGKTKEEIFELVRTWEERLYAKERWYYNELEKEDDGSLIFRSSSLKSERIIYSRKLLEKYERIIWGWFSDKIFKND